MFKYIFGPIVSRRFGTSLGIDLSPQHKRCNFDCVYCELQPQKAMEDSDAQFDAKDVVAELKTALIEHPHIDVITITANGEPSMYHEFDALVDALLALDHQAKLLVLSNAALIDHESVQKSFMKLDQVKLSLDAVTESVFKKIDRPHKTLSIENIKAGIESFAKIYQGDLIIEILFVKGINDSDEEIAKMNSFLRSIKPHRIDIGTIDRPPAYPVAPISNERLDQIATQFDPELPISIAHRKAQKVEASFYPKDEILSTLEKRPLTVHDVHQLFDTPTLITLQELIEANEVSVKQTNEEAFYVLTKNLEKKRPKA